MDGALSQNRTGLAAAVVALVGVLVGLGALLNLGPFAEDELSVAEFLARGDEICAEAHDGFLEFQDRTPRTAEEAASLTAALIELAEQELDDVESLAAPAGLAEALAAYLDDRRDGIRVLREGLEAAEGDDATAYERAQAQLDSSQRRRAKAAEDVGFNECSQPLADRDEPEAQGGPPS